MLRVTDDGKSVMSISNTGAAAETASALVEMLFLKVSKLAEKEAMQRSLQAKVHGVHGVNLNFGAVSSFQVNPEHLGWVIGSRGINIKSVQALPGTKSCLILPFHQMIYIHLLSYM